MERQIFLLHALLMVMSNCLIYIHVNFNNNLDELIRVYENPDLHPVHFCQISRSPLYSVIFYSA